MNGFGWLQSQLGGWFGFYVFIYSSYFYSKSCGSSRIRIYLYCWIRIRTKIAGVGFSWIRTYIARSGSSWSRIQLELDSAGSEPIMLDPDPILLGPILLDSETTGSGSNCIRTYIAGSGSNWIRSYIVRFWYYWIRTYIFAGSGIFWRLDRFLYLKNTYLTIINTFNAFI